MKTDEKVLSLTYRIVELSGELEKARKELGQILDEYGKNYLSKMISEDKENDKAV